MDLLHLFAAFVMLYIVVSVLSILVRVGFFIFRRAHLSMLDLQLFLLKRKARKITAKAEELRRKNQRIAFYITNMQRPGNITDAQEVHHA